MQPSITQELWKYWIITMFTVILLGMGLGKLGQAKLTAAPSMFIMDQNTKTQIVNRLDNYDTRLNKIDSRLTTVETRVSELSPSKTH